MLGKIRPWGHIACNGWLQCCSKAYRGRFHLIEAARANRQWTGVMAEIKNSVVHIIFAVAPCLLYEGTTT